MTEQLEVRQVSITASGKAFHKYSDGSIVMFTRQQKETEWLAPMSKVEDEQYKASQRHAPEETFLLSIFS